MPVAKEEKESKNISDREKLVQNKAILDSLNSEKSKKDVMLMNIDEINKHILHLKKITADLHQEYETKRKIVDSLNGSIAGAQAHLSMLNADFEKKNQSLVKEFQKKLSDVESSDKTLRQLINDNQESKRLNDVEKAKLAEYRQICDSQVNEMKKALSQNNSEWSKREADILEREKQLSSEKESFEAERNSLIPQLAHISSIKNENILLLQKIEADKNNVSNLRLSIESERQRLAEDRASIADKLKQKETSFLNEEARLREWEQNLKDYDLEIRAKASEAEKVLKRQQLQSKVDSGKK